jgi:glycosyltransferase involved in cell wall biosynthesis
MRIAIDVQPLQTETRFSQIGNYLRNVLQQLHHIDADNEYTFLLNNSDRLADLNTSFLTWKKHYLTRKHLLGRWWWCWDTVYLPTGFIQKDIDVFHYNSLAEAEHMAPPKPFGKHRVVATIPDLIPLKFPEPVTSDSSSAKWHINYSTKLRRLEHADALITLSECSKQAILERLAYPEERVFVAYTGISEMFRHQPSHQHYQDVVEKYQLPDNFILYLGNDTRPRKNIERFLKAYKILRHSLPAPQPYLLLIGFSDSSHQEQIAALSHKLELTPYILTLPAVEHDALPCLYRAATLFVAPSLYESFSLPVVEAMACGAVVAISNTSCFPEIVGNAGLYFDPYDINSIAETMFHGVSDREKRQHLQAYAPQQTLHYSWSQTARSILAVYTQVHGA